MCGPADGRLWADPRFGLMRFGSLHTLTLHERPALVPCWLSRLPVSLERLTIAAAPRTGSAYDPDGR